VARSTRHAEYAQRFAENGINFAALRYLTDQDLKDIGVLLGHRRIILGVISELTSVGPSETEPATKPAGASASTSDAPSISAASASPTMEASGERRRVTVLFCDLVDSTGIAAKLDAEEWRDLVGAYLDAASVAVTEMGSKVAKRLGDGLMALVPLHSGFD
jgi:SAM domain (Sterile alpha motif)